jgi:hypothetical protein
MPHTRLEKQAVGIIGGLLWICLWETFSYNFSGVILLNGFGSDSLITTNSQSIFNFLFVQKMSIYS